MGLNRYAKRRDENEPEILAALRKVGLPTIRQDSPFDQLVGIRSRWIPFEIKDGSKPPSKRILTPSEEDFRALCAYYRLPYFVVSSVDEALSAVRAVEAQA